MFVLVACLVIGGALLLASLVFLAWFAHHSRTASLRPTDHVAHQAARRAPASTADVTPVTAREGTAEALETIVRGLQFMDASALYRPPTPERLAREGVRLRAARVAREGGVTAVPGAYRRVQDVELPPYTETC